MASPDETRVDQPIRLRPVWSLYGAWQAVDDGKPIDEYLLYRFRLYESQGRKSSHPLRYDIAITPSGRIVLTIRQRIVTLNSCPGLSGRPC